MAKKTLYICHTYYHVYVSLLKEFARNPEEQGHATVYLSTMSTDFENFKDRLEASGCVEKVITYEEKLPGFFKDLEKYKKPSKFFPAAIANRIKYTKKLGKYEEAYIPEDLKQCFQGFPKRLPILVSEFVQHFLKMRVAFLNMLLHQNRSVFGQIEEPRAAVAWIGTAVHKAQFA